MSAGGSRIHRYEPRAAELRAGVGDAELIDAMAAHVEEYFERPGQVFHEVLSGPVHIDVFHAEPSESFPDHTLVTCGMSERPMPAPDSFPEGRYAELVLRLPPSWPVDPERFDDPAVYWPVRLLKELAVFPHLYDAWIWKGHTIPNGDPPEPYAPGTMLSGAMLAPPLLGPDGFETLRAGEREVSLLGVILLHSAEMDLKLDRGTEPLLDLLDDAEASELVEPDRPSVVRRSRRLFGRR